MIHQHDGEHGFCNRRGANTDARVMSTLGHDFDRVAVDIHRTPWQTHAGCRLERHVDDDILPRCNAAERAAGMVRQKAFGGDFIAMLGAFLRHAIKTCANLDALDRIDAHHRMRNLGIDTIKNGFTQPHRHALGDNRYSRADRIAFLAQRIHIGFQFGHPGRIGAEEWIIVDRIPVFQRQLDRPELRQIATDANAMFLGQIFLGDTARRNAHGGFARR